MTSPQEQATYTTDSPTHPYPHGQAQAFLVIVLLVIVFLAMVFLVMQGTSE